MAKSSGLLKKAFHEVYNNPPATLKKGASKDNRRKQLIAIALSKARAKGSKIPKK